MANAFAETKPSTDKAPAPAEEIVTTSCPPPVSTTNTSTTSATTITTTTNIIDANPDYYPFHLFMPDSVKVGDRIPILSEVCGCCFGERYDDYTNFQIKIEDENILGTTKEGIGVAAIVALGAGTSDFSICPLNSDIEFKYTITVEPTPIDYPWGDANCDLEVNLADSILIMQVIAQPNKFGIDGTDENHISEPGLHTGDVAGFHDGITNNDARAIQMYSLGMMKSLNPWLVDF